MRMRRLRMTSRAFEKVATIGKGAFGKVMLVRMRGTNQLFAMKKLRKGLSLTRIFCFAFLWVCVSFCNVCVD